ncbi:MAG: sugar phosphate isomerase/epimerase family protein [Clostridia bacterium]|nr:sugar phosphate isomerase/epimerase [Oscillospiraceae bacterium]MDY3303201.1 sugar phosphate isomerase/epimerase family protein [Clostridia bacterium]
MIFGNAAWGFRETPLEKQLKITKSIGLSVLELGIANSPVDLPLNISDYEIANVKALFEKYGVHLMCAATGNDFTFGNNNDVDKIKKVIDICQKLGVTYLRIFAGFSPVKEVVNDRWKVMVDCLNTVYDYAEDKFVIPVVETHGGVDVFDDGVKHFLSTSVDKDTLVKMMNDVPNIKFNYDPANFYAVGNENPENVYEIIKDNVCYIHFKDFVKLENGHFYPSYCGKSNMDWNKILKPLKDFDGPALFEYENTYDIADGCKRCYEFIKQKIKEIQK